MIPNKRSFTLIEILVVILIVAILSTFIFVGINSITKKARDAQRKAEIVKLRDIIWSISNMGASGYVETPFYGPMQYENSGNTLCYLGTEDPNCSAIEQIIEETTIIPKDPLSSSDSKEWDYVYKSDGETFDLYAKLEEGGVAYLSESTVSFTDNNDNCEDNWINTGLGFCVMQYEAKNVGGIPVSQASGTPWVNVSLNQAKNACRSIGAHLITNTEWISIARDAESVSSNWDSGVMMAQGYSAGVMSGCSEGWSNTSFASNTDSDIETCIQNSNCSYTYNTGANTLAGTGNHRYRRYLTLSNNEVIVDFSGNAWEWVDLTILNSQIPTPTGKREFSSITNWGGVLSYDSIAPKTMPSLIPAGIGDINSWSPSYSEEETYDNTVYGIVRGGYYGGCAGAFDTYIGYAPSGIGDNVGFRCAK